MRESSCPPDWSVRLNPYALASTPSVFHVALYSEVPSTACPGGHVTAFTVRDGCPYLDDYDGSESDSFLTAAPALANSLPVCESVREPMLKKLDGVSISKEGCSKILDLVQKVGLGAIVVAGICIGHTH